MAAFNRGFELETKMREKEARRSVGGGGGGMQAGQAWHRPLVSLEKVESQADKNTFLVSRPRPQSP